MVTAPGRDHVLDRRSDRSRLRASRSLALKATAINRRDGVNADSLDRANSRQALQRGSVPLQDPGETENDRGCQNPAHDAEANDHNLQPAVRQPEVALIQADHR